MVICFPPDCVPHKLHFYSFSSQPYVEVYDPSFHVATKLIVASSFVQVGSLANDGVDSCQGMRPDGPIYHELQ